MEDMFLGFGWDKCDGRIVNGRIVGGRIKGGRIVDNEIVDIVWKDYTRVDKKLGKININTHPQGS